MIASKFQRNNISENLIVYVFITFITFLYNLISKVLTKHYGFILKL